MNLKESYATVFMGIFQETRVLSYKGQQFKADRHTDEHCDTDGHAGR